MRVGYQFAPDDPRYYLEHLPSRVDLDTVWVEMECEQRATDGLLTCRYALLYNGNRSLSIDREYLSRADTESCDEFINQIAPTMTVDMGHQGWRGPRAS